MAQLLICLSFAFSLLTLSAFAQANEGKTTSTAIPLVSSPFERGARELQFAVGVFVSENYHDELRPQLHDVDATARLGWMLNSPAGRGIVRGNFEFLAEFFGAGIVKGPGQVLAGTTLWLRYNYVQPAARLVPYVQVGAGGVYSDAHEERPQRLLGSAAVFNLQAGFGARYFWTEKCALFLEFDYRHLSNAGAADRNRGLNSAGSWLGASFFF